MEIKYGADTLRINRTILGHSFGGLFGAFAFANHNVAFIPETLRCIEPLGDQDVAITRKVRLSVGPSLKDGMDFLVNGDVHVNDKPVVIGEL